MVDNLDVLRRKDVERHLKTCSQCARFLDQIRLLRLRLKNLTPVKTSDSFQVLLRERIRREMAGKRRTAASSTSFTKRWIPAFGFVVLVLIAGIWMIDQKTSFFDSGDNEGGIARSTTPGEESFDGQVQYVINDFPSRISVSRTEDAEGAESVVEDSLIRQNDWEDVRARLTPVSF